MRAKLWLVISLRRALVEEGRSVTQTQLVDRPCGNRFQRNPSPNGIGDIGSLVSLSCPNHNSIPLQDRQPSLADAAGHRKSIATGRQI